jgi:hypothetical protein
MPSPTEVVAKQYGLTDIELHETLMSRRGVRALCAAVDAAILRGDIDARSYIADARLTIAGVPGYDIATDPAELSRRVAITRPSAEMKRIEASYGRDDIEVVRVDGGATCPTCGKTYREHPWDEQNLSGLDGEPFLRVGCDGARLKL